MIVEIKDNLFYSSAMITSHQDNVICKTQLLQITAYGLIRIINYSWQTLTLRVLFYPELGVLWWSLYYVCVLSSLMVSRFHLHTHLNRGTVHVKRSFCL